MGLLITLVYFFCCVYYNQRIISSLTNDFMRLLITIAKKLAVRAQKVRSINMILFGLALLLSGVAIGQSSVPQFVQEVWAAAIDGFGTVGKVAAFSNSSTIGDSQIFDNGVSIGVGNDNPTVWSKLDVNGRIAAGDSLQLRGGGDVREGGQVILNHFGDQAVGERPDSWSIDNDAGGRFRIFWGSQAFNNEVLALSALPSGNVGIGVLDPLGNLDVIHSLVVAEDVGATNRFNDAIYIGRIGANIEAYGARGRDGNGAANNQILVFDANNGIFFRNDAVNANQQFMMINSAGNVRIGAGTPMATLDVGGFVRIGTSGEPCDDAHTGMLGVNSSRNLFYCKDASTGWRQINP